MPSYTTRIRLEKQTPGENSNTWGVILNDNVINLIDDSIAAYTTITVSSVDVTLTQASGASDQARSAFLDISGTLTGNVNILIPALSKGYGIRNSTSGSFTVNTKTATGTGRFVPQGQTINIVCDGVSIRDIEVPGIQSSSNVVNVSVGTSLVDIKVPVAISGTVSITGNVVVSGTSSFFSNITMKAENEVRFADADSSHYIAIQAPATVTANVTYTLPHNDGIDGQFLKTNGSGILSFTSSIPIGTVLPFAGSSLPANGWLFCNGQAINRTTYSALFTTIGTTYGVGDGSLTFNIPDMRGRVPAGLDVDSSGFALRITVTASDVSGTVLGSTGGTQTHTLTAGELPTSATYRNFTSEGGQGGTASSGLAQYVSISALTGANDEPHLNLQPTIILNYIIRTE